MGQDSFSYYQTGWEPTYARRGLGTVLVADAMQLASIPSDCAVFDFLRGDELFKYRFGAEDREDDDVGAPGAGRWPMDCATPSRHEGR